MIIHYILWIFGQSNIKNTKLLKWWWYDDLETNWSHKMIMKTANMLMMRFELTVTEENLKLIQIHSFIWHVCSSFTVLMWWYWWDHKFYVRNVSILFMAKYLCLYISWCSINNNQFTVIQFKYSLVYNRRWHLRFSTEFPENIQYDDDIHISQPY